MILLGNLGADPEVTTLESGVKLARLRIATNEFFRGQEGESVEKTEWHNVVLWRNKAELAEKYLQKGRTVYLEGRLRTRQWQDKDGNQRYSTEILGDVINFIGGRPDQASDSRPTAGSSSAQAPAPDTPPEEDDLPF